MLPMLDTGEEVPLRRAVAFQLVGDEHPWRVRQTFEQLPEELFGRMLVPPTLHQDIEDVPLLIDRLPEIVLLAVNREKDFIQMPRVTWLGAPATQLVRVGLTKLSTPLANRFIRHEDAAGKQQIFDIPVAEAEPVVQPHTMADDLDRKAIILVAVGR
jgi:hypothetical protein